MKKLSFLLIGAAIVSACTTRSAVHSARNTKPDFTATFIVPLTEGRDNGESTILDPEFVKAVNLDILKPVFQRLVQDAYEGKLATHPDYEDAPAYEPRSLFRDRVTRLAGANPDLSHATISLQVGYNGIVAPASTKLKVSFVDLIWVDPSQVAPELLIARVKAKDLEKYKVERFGLSCSLREFLDEGMYERYPIRVATPVDDFGIKTHAEAVMIGDEIRYGNVAKLSRSSE